MTTITDILAEDDAHSTSVWTLRSVEQKEPDHSNAQHVLALIDETDPSNPCVIDEVRYVPLAKDLSHKFSVKYDQGPPVRMLGIWKNIRNAIAEKRTPDLAAIL